jgi:hypothetical protein
MAAKSKIKRCLALSCFIGGFLITIYLCWALYRSRMKVMLSEISDKHWPRSWPFPDKLIVRWQDWLDAANPAPGFIKLHGEWSRLHFYLCCWIGLSITVTLCGIVWIGVLRRKECLN